MTTNLRNRLELAGGALLAMLDSEMEFMPTGGYEVAHDLGRWWDAVLRLERTIGFIIPAELEAASLRNLQMLTDNPDRLLMNRPDVPWLQDKAKINPHNFRETLLTYAGLVRCRQSAWACDAGLQLVRSMDRSLRHDGRLDFTKLGSWGTVPLTDDPMMLETIRNGWFDGTATSGRSIEALVEFYEAMRESIALEVAQRIAEHHLQFSTNRNGSARSEIVNPANMGHNHSYHGMLRGLLRFGLQTGQKEYVEVVEATYRHADHKRIVMESGWAPHDIGMNRFLNQYGDPVADPASTGDAAQLALRLALDAGHMDLLDDVERYVRARLLPAQLTENDVSRNPGRTFEKRDIGSWTIHGPSHAGKGCTPDVLAAVTHSLCDIYQHICTRTEEDIRVNLHFDYENDQIKIASQRDYNGRVTVQLKQPRSVLIRIPGWVVTSSLAVSVDGRPYPAKRVGHFVRIDGDHVREHSEITLCHDLPERRTEEHMLSGRVYRLQWRGDEINHIAPQDESLPFYP